MPDQLTEYLELCLSQVPPSDYRLRLRQELDEHLTDLTEGFLSRGYDGTEAALRAMEKMGKPELLREEYRLAWLRQPERFRRVLRRLALGCLLAMAGHMLALLFLEYFGSGADEAVSARRLLKVYGSPRWRLFAETVLFLGETLPCFIWLLLRFRREPDRRAWVTAGLLLVWAMDKAMLLLRDGALPLPYFFATLGASLVIGLVL